MEGKGAELEMLEGFRGHGKAAARQRVVSDVELGEGMGWERGENGDSTIDEETGKRVEAVVEDGESGQTQRRK